MDSPTHIKRLPPKRQIGPKAGKSGGYRRYTPEQYAELGYRVVELREPYRRVAASAGVSNTTALRAMREYRAATTGEIPPPSSISDPLPRDGMTDEYWRRLLVRAGELIARESQIEQIISSRSFLDRQDAMGAVAIYEAIGHRSDITISRLYAALQPDADGHSAVPLARLPAGEDTQNPDTDTADLGEFREVPH